jgi:hypothetical protein
VEAVLRDVAERGQRERFRSRRQLAVFAAAASVLACAAAFVLWLQAAPKPTPIVKHKTIDIINAGESKTVTFTDLGPPPFGVPTTVKVDVQPVPGEKNTSNNSAEYRVIFSLG